MFTRLKWVSLTIVILLGLLNGCSSGTSGTTAAPPPPPPPPPPPISGIGRYGIAIGPVANFGSIIVNGVTYNTDNATFTIDGAPATQADLRVGHVVKVLGDADDNGLTGTADEVLFDDSVKGPIESIDTALNLVVVLGQLVVITPETSFDDSLSPSTIEGLSVGQIVEVSGQIDATGNIVATRIEPKPAGTQFEVHGTVSGLDAATMQFNINSLVVDFSAATLDNFPSGQISDGDFVEAKGMSLGAAGELLATKVELETLLTGVVDGDRIELEGFITRFASAQDFDVSGQSVTTNASTVFTGGVAADLGLNVKVEVDGDLDGNNILVASKVDIRPSKAVRSQALLDSVDSATNSVVLLGITVTTDELTRFEDKSNADVDPLTLSDLNAGDFVEVRGDEFPAGSGNIRAIIFEREDPDPDTILQGFVESISEPSFTILGVTIDASSTVVFRDENDAPISSADFFNQLDINSLVKAKGTEVSDTTISATEVEFELEF